MFVRIVSYIYKSTYSYTCKNLNNNLPALLLLCVLAFAFVSEKRSTLPADVVCDRLFFRLFACTLHFSLSCCCKFLTRVCTYVRVYIRDRLLAVFAAFLNAWYVNTMIKQERGKSNRFETLFASQYCNKFHVFLYVCVYVHLQFIACFNFYRMIFLHGIVKLYIESAFGTDGMVTGLKKYIKISCFFLWNGMKFNVK